MIIDKLTNKLKYKELFIKPSDFVDSTFCFCCVAFFKKIMRIGTCRINGFIDKNDKTYKHHKHSLPILTIDNLRTIVKDYDSFYSPDLKPEREKLIFIVYKKDYIDTINFAIYKPRKNTFRYYNICSEYVFNTGHGRFFPGNGNTILKWCYYDEIYEYILELSK